MNVCLRIGKLGFKSSLSHKLSALDIKSNSFIPIIYPGIKGWTSPSTYKEIPWSGQAGAGSDLLDCIVLEKPASLEAQTGRWGLIQEYSNEYRNLGQGQVSMNKSSEKL